jgi:hypothetical protein
MLIEVRGRVKSGELDLQNEVPLTDRVLSAQGRKRRYGTHFEVGADGLVARPLEDPRHVDDRRRAMGLTSLADYACILKAANEVRERLLLARERASLAQSQVGSYTACLPGRGVNRTACHITNRSGG